MKKDLQKLLEIAKEFNPQAISILYKEVEYGFIKNENNEYLSFIYRKAERVKETLK